MTKKIENIGKFMLLIDYSKRYFVVSIMWAIYSTIAIGAMSVTYIVFKKLDDIGVFKMFSAAAKDNLSEITRIATKCTGEILEINKFISCLMN